MADNDTLRREMEAYMKKHDIQRLFERLAASIMYERPEDLNHFIGEWLLRLNVGVEKPGGASSAVKSKSSADASISKKSSASVPSGSKTVVTADPTEPPSSDPKVSASNLEEAPTAAAVTKPEPEPSSMQAGQSIPAVTSTASVSKSAVSVTATPPPGENRLLNGRNEFDPYTFTPENIAVFYGMLDPLNEGAVSLEHFREVAALLDVEQYIEWKEIHGSEILREHFIDLLTTALKEDLDTLRTNCQENPKDALLFTV
ncbi:hypothetical protein BV898_10616 [Hypsibius exemplaris]|uniref:Uncharacterized protein n=1 Tax=Hypsibius exemplaris TaxID=2072580 RepID=A0A1W0WJ46_HYPEX|nr:hypothetical protein BV898_10616 [Hypsibius exemplaris]